MKTNYNKIMLVLYYFFGKAMPIALIFPVYMTGSPWWAMIIIYTVALFLKYIGFFAVSIAALICTLCRQINTVSIVYFVYFGAFVIYIIYSMCMFGYNYETDIDFRNFVDKTMKK